MHFKTKHSKTMCTVNDKNKTYCRHLTKYLNVTKLLEMTVIFTIQRKIKKRRKKRRKVSLLRVGISVKPVLVLFTWNFVLKQCQ